MHASVGGMYASVGGMYASECGALHFHPLKPK